MNAIEAFERWLADEGYQPSTVLNWGRSLAAMVRAETEGVTVKAHQVYVSAAQAFLRWPQSTETPQLRRYVEDFVADVTAQRNAPVNRVAARRQAQAKRKREARSIGGDAFQRLAETTWQHDDPAAVALSIVYVTGIRVGDMLAVERRKLQEAKQHGVLRLDVKGGDERLLPWLGAEEEWAKLLGLFSGQPQDIRTVADLVVGRPDASTLAGDGAYTRLRRRLKELAEESGIDERVHLHRLRRTVAVRALSQTNDIAAVQQLLGHRSINTTARYVDETRPEALAGLQQTINPRKHRT